MLQKRIKVGSNKKRFMFFMKKRFKGVFDFQIKHKFIFSIIILVFILILAGYILLSQTLLSPKYNIGKINFLQENIDDYDDPYFYRDIENALSGQNYFTAKYLYLGKTLYDLQQKHIILKDIDIIKKSDNQIIAKMNFNNPNLILNDGIRNIGVINGKTFDMGEKSKLLEDAQKIYVPEYIQDYNHLTGFFYKIPENKLKFQIHEINNFIGKDKIEKITYLPGVSRTIIDTEGKKIFINNLHSISFQLKKLLLLRKNQGKDNLNFDEIKEIDLGTGSPENTLSSDYIIIK